MFGDLLVSIQHLRSATRPPAQPIRLFPILRNLPVLLLPFRLLRLRRRTALERLLEILDDIVDVFGPHRDPDQGFRDARVFLFAVRELFVCCGPGVDGEGFGVADAGGGLAGEYWVTRRGQKKERREEGRERGRRCGGIYFAKFEIILNPSTT